jgi:serine/threonine protein kinase
MNEETLFHLAREKPPAERGAFLDEACAGDDALRRRIERLLQAHDDPGSLLDRPAAETETVASGAALPALQPDSKVRYFGDYELLEEIARGGMGVVYRARQVSLDRVVAVKMILAGQLASEGSVKRFHSEAEAAARLNHPGIVPIFEVGEHEGQHYFSMKFVAGPSLAQRLTDGPVSNPEAAALVRACARAVHYAHEHGVIHRDLKPANILLEPKQDTGEPGTSPPGGQTKGKTDQGASLADYEPVISDFGLAKQLGRGQGMTASGHVLGTPGYMPPEQAAGAGKAVGPAADIYSLGAVLYALLTGRPPFQAGNDLDTLLQVIDREPVPPSQLNAKTARDLQTICLKCLEKRPERRYGSARELADDLERFLNYEPIHARPVNPLRRAGVWLKRRPWTIAAAAVSGVVAVLLLAYWLRAEIRDRDWQILLLQARQARQAIPHRAEIATGKQDGKASTSPAAEEALSLLQKAARLRPDAEIYKEALNVWVAEDRCGRQIFPTKALRPDAFPELWQPALGLPGDSRQKELGLRHFQLSRDGRWGLLLGVLFDMRTGKAERLGLPNAASATMDPTGRWLAVFPTPGVLKIYNRASRKEQQVFDRRPDIIELLKFTRDGNRLVVMVHRLTATRTIEVRETASGKILSTLRLKTGPNLPECAVSGDGRLLAWSPSTNKTLLPAGGGWRFRWPPSVPGPVQIHVHDLATGKKVATWTTPGQKILASLALDTSGTRLAWSNHWVPGDSPTVEIRTVPEGAVVGQLRCGESFVYALSFTPDGKHLVGQGHGDLDPDSRIWVWEVATGKLVLWLPAEAFINCTGGEGNFVVARRMGRNGSESTVLDMVQSDKVLAELDRAGLTACMETAVPKHISSLGTWMLTVCGPVFMVLMAYLIFHTTEAQRVRKGLPPFSTVPKVAAGLGILGGLIALGQLLALFDSPQRRGADAALGALAGSPLETMRYWGMFFNVLALALTPKLIWHAVRHYRASVYGEKLPDYASYPSLSEFRKLFYRTAGWLYLFLGPFFLSAWLDGLVQLKMFGSAVDYILGFAMVIILLVVVVNLVGTAVAMVAVVFLVLTGHWRKRSLQSSAVEEERPAEGEKQAIRSGWRIGIWLASLLAASVVVVLEIGQRLKAGTWPRLRNIDPPGQISYGFVGRDVGWDEWAATLTLTGGLVVLLVCLIGLWHFRSAGRVFKAEKD